MLFRNLLGLVVCVTIILGSILMAGPVQSAESEAAGRLRVGWASADITPDKPVPLVGFSSARISAGVMDPINATALVLESGGDDGAGDMAVLVSIDMAGVGNELQAMVREKVSQAVPEMDAEKRLTGVVINIACPSQASGGSRITADFWYDTRNELRSRLGEELFILPQCSAAGDQSPVVMVDKKAESRMERLSQRDRRGQIAVRIADAVTSVLPYMEKHIDFKPVLAHRVEQVELSRRMLSEDDIKKPRATHHRPQVESVEQAFERLLGEYRKLREEIEKNPEAKQKSNWFRPVSAVYWRLARASRVLDRYELQKTEPSMLVPVHVVRIGDMVIATNPFELYLDFGIQMKARSKAVQTFVVELAGGSGFGYLPTARSVAGGAYGAIPESTNIGPEGGRELVEQTLELIDSLWADE